MSETLGLASTPSEIGERDLRDTTVLVVDVLRATTTAVTALAAGADRVIPTAEITQAFDARRRSGSGATLLCGEREAVKIDGFDLGNSPLEYTRDRVAGKTVVLCSTNGTGTLVRCREAKRLATASFVNAGAAAAWLMNAPGPMLVVCSGKLGRMGLEDLGAGGCLVEAAVENRPGLELDDGARAALAVWNAFEADATAILERSDHGRYLRSMGFGSDLEFCAIRDRFDLVPIWRHGDLILEA